VLAKLEHFKLSILIILTNIARSYVETATKETSKNAMKNNTINGDGCSSLYT